MRFLLILQGAPGSGKSTFLEREGLTPWAVSSDAVRLLYRGLEQRREGRLGIPTSADGAAWRTLMQAVEMRMDAGDLTIVDATHTRRREVEQYRELAERYRYQSYVVSWRELPLAECLRRNGGRQDFRRVPEHVIHEMYARLQEFTCPRFATMIRPEELGRYLADPVVDGAPYRRLHVIGDVQGCATPLKELFGAGPRDDELYAFIGDLLDRGIENAAVMRMVLPLAQRPNVIFCEGNHERHLRRWVDGHAATSKTFENLTRPELERGGITRDAVRPLLARLVDAALIDWRGVRVLLTHGGLAAMPEPGRLALVPSSQLIKGVGPHDFDVDQAFAGQEPDADARSLQIHGHRNESKHPTAAAHRSYNLEGRVEFGGALRTVTFHDDGRIETRDIANPLFDQRAAADEEVDYQRRTAGRTPKSNVSAAASMVAEMRRNPYVTEKVLPGDLASFNFSREAFREGVWDAQTIRARGLFVNTRTMEVVARSYDKFFNLGETEATSPQGLAARLRFPLRIWVKENGFLGIVGFDGAADRVVYASKSTTEQEFAHAVREILHDAAKVDPEKLKAIVARGFSLVFEVIDPVKDPHIIKYPERRVVLLDAVRNSVEFKALPYPQLAGMAGHLGIPAKALHRELPDLHAFDGFVREATAEPHYLVNGQHVEGFVVEDAAGFMLKIKLPYYSLWKRLRTAADALARGKEPRGSESLPAVGQEFLLWLRRRPDLHGRPIIALRDAFEQDKGSAPAVVKVG